MGITSQSYSVAHVATTDTLTWLRGIAVTDSTGTATIYTNYPGHYTGRSPHIHGKVGRLACLNAHTDCKQQRFACTSVQCAAGKAVSPWPACCGMHVRP